MSSIVDQIEQKLDYTIFYSKFVEGLKHSGDGFMLGNCPFHDDSNKSFSINITNGLWRCFAGCGEGNIYQFIEFKFQIKTKKDRIEFLCNELGIKFEEYKVSIINNNIYLDFHSYLLDNKSILDKFIDKTNYTLETIKKYKIGYEENAQRITFPIFNESNECINIRRYDFGKKKQKLKYLNYTDTKGKYGAMKLYPIDALDKKKVLLCEGERDAIFARQKGYNALTVTSGAGSFSRGFVPKFKDKIVYICYDIDNSGQKGSLRVAKYLMNVASKIYIVELNKVINEPPNADLSDFFQLHNFTTDDFNELLKDTKEFEPPKIQQKTTRNKEYKKVSLAQASHSVNAMMNIETKALVSGKSYPPFEIPNHCHITCDGKMGEQICSVCPVWMEDNKIDLNLADVVDNGSLLSMIDIPDSQLFGVIRTHAMIHPKCNRWNVNIKSYLNVEELRLIPEITFTDDEDYEYVQQVAYYAGHSIKTNQVYTFRGLALPNPKNQQATQLFEEAEIAVDSIDSFKMEPEIKKELEIFQPKDSETLLDSYIERYKDIESISGIFDRIDISLCYDITIHSALEFFFQNRLEHGWIESLIIGDSGCGKTALAKALIQHYSVGEFVTGESSSVAGLLGGLSQTSKKWHINWGKIPLNNKRLVVIDELSGMETDDIALFSGVRSSGIAELTKIRTEKTWAKTRKIWISNPRKKGEHPRYMMDYSYGCIAVRELIGALEDIRRFDFVISAHSDEIDKKVYNRKNKQNYKMKFTDELCHKLVMWIWSRKAKDIIFESDAKNKILDLAYDMGQKYYHGIPIVEAADQRIKLAKGAVAVAGMFFSCDDTGEKIVVKTEHVDFFYNWLEKVYNKDSMRYGEWSKIQINKKELKNRTQVDLVIHDDEWIDIWLENDMLNLSVLADILDVERAETKKMISTLLKNNAVKRVGTSYYRKTEAFIKYLVDRKTGKFKVAKPAQLDWETGENNADDIPF